MTDNEALKLAKGGLKVYKEQYPDLKPQIEFQEKIVETLEKQIPKKPNYIRMLSESIKVGACPICNAGCNYAMSYCENCGQALDWDDTEDLNKIKKENKQEPKKVIVTDDECLCPSCKFDMMGIWDEPEAENPNYCPRCGQALDWSDEQ